MAMSVPLSPVSLPPATAEAALVPLAKPDDVPALRRAAEVELRDLRPDDRSGLHQVLVGTGVFTTDEVQVALELIDEGLCDYSSRYRFVVADVDGRTAGYACYARTPCTDAVYDLCWIAVDRRQHGRGVGRRLLDEVEGQVRAQGGRMLLIETESNPAYESTRGFYLRRGCTEVARIPDFYRPGADKVVYCKRI